MISSVKELRSFFGLLFLTLFIYSFYQFTLFTLFLWVVFAVTLWLFREEHHHTPSQPLAVLSPVYGTLCFSQAEKIPFLDVPGVHSKIIKHFYDEQVIYSPIEGTVKEIWFPGSDTMEQKLSLLIETDEHDQVILQMQRNGFGLLKLFIQPGQRVGQGRRIGLCIFRYIIDVFVPESAHVKPDMDTQKVVAAETVLAELQHERLEST